MMSRWRRSRWVAGGAALLACLWTTAAHAATLKPGNKMPNFALRDLNGKMLRLSSYRNRAVWLTLFSSH
jgi:hypothetical protein